MFGLVWSCPRRYLCLSFKNSLRNLSLTWALDDDVKYLLAAIIWCSCILLISTPPYDGTNSLFWRCLASSGPGSSVKSLPNPQLLQYSWRGILLVMVHPFGVCCLVVEIYEFNSCCNTPYFVNMCAILLLASVKVSLVQLQCWHMYISMRSYP